MRTPLAIFCYKRPDHLSRLLKSLSTCQRLGEIEPVYFCDGPKDPDDGKAVEKTRRVAKKWQQRLGGRLVIQERNQGMAKSIIAGASELCAEFGRVIVVEDDLVLSGEFLNYHLSALGHYEQMPDVWQISGFAFRIAPVLPDQSYFLPIISTWGWSTWDRAWCQFNCPSITRESITMDDASRRRFDIDGAFPYSQMLNDSLEGKNDSWGIRWNWRVFRHDGLVLFPPMSLAYNAGYDGSGSHCHSRETSWQPSEKEVLAHRFSRMPGFPPPTAVDPEQRARLHALLSGM